MRDDLDPELLTWLWRGLFLVALVRTSIADDGVARQAVDAGRVLAEVMAPSSRLTTRPLRSNRTPAARKSDSRPQDGDECGPTHPCGAPRRAISQEGS